MTEKDLFSWIGKDCNPYEKAKVSKRLIYNNILISIFVSLGLSFLTGSLKKNMKVVDEQSSFAVPTIFFFKKANSLMLV